MEPPSKIPTATKSVRGDGTDGTGFKAGQKDFGVVTKQTYYDPSINKPLSMVVDKL